MIMIRDYIYHILAFDLLACAALAAQVAREHAREMHEMRGLAHGQ